MSTPAAKSHRSVSMAPTGATRAAAAFVEREWGEMGYRIGYAGQAEPVNGAAIYVFQVCAGDGSRFLVWSTVCGEVGTFPAELEQTIGARLDVEVSAS